MPTEIMLAVTHAFGLMAICTMAFGQFQRRMHDNGSRSCAIGALLGLATAIAMLQPFLSFNGYQVDGRNMFLAISAAFGGVVAVSLSALIAIIMRIWLGGAGVGFGIASIIMVSALGIFWAHITHHEARRPIFSWVVLGAFLSVPMLAGVLVMRIEMPPLAFMRIIPDVIFALVFGKMFESELRRGQRERQLSREASTDPLTGLPNRRALMVRIGEMTPRERHGMALLMIDADHFKAVNDTYGHDVGDEVLRLIASSLQNSLREGDFVARFGGEEFAVLLHLNSANDGYAVADRLRIAASGRHQINGHQVVVTVSVGGKRLNGEPFDFASAYAGADAALYEAKKNGRDRTVFA